ncbi:MAG: putative Ig domain-containing protein [Planctomycetes bacterium]|nr:putative Ig domain-containing protein [Planctomycetota bacterium]
MNLNDRVVLVRKSPEKITLREPYEFQFSARVGQNVENPERLKWVIHSGALPPGISLDRTTGVVSGVVAEEAHLGSYTVVIAASISGSGGTPWLYSDDHEFTLDVVPPPPPPAPVIETDALESGWAAEVYGPVQLLATSDVLPLDWSATSGLPAGLVVSADGVISGMIDDQAAIADSVVYTVTLQVTDAIGQAAMRDVEMTVNPELRILTGSLPVAVVAERYGATLEGVGGSGEYEWTWGGALPTGLRIILTRLGWEISGTPYPEDEGTHAVSVTMTDAENGLYSRTASFTLDILSAGSAPLRLITTYLAPANEGESYFLALESSGGEAPYDLSGTTGLPHGLSVSGSGTSWYITGKPEIAGEYAVTVALRDAAGEIQTTTLTLLVYTEPLGDPDREPGDPDAELGIAPGKTLLAGSAPAGGCALGMESRREQNWLFVAVAMGFIAAGVGRRFSRRRAAASNA